MQQRIAVMAISAVLGFFFCVPIGFLIYGGLGAAIGGALILGGLIAIQVPVFLLFKRLGWLPTRNEFDDQQEE